ncbi:hypothetical protein PoB_004076000 [Plakobranchus ocellatus]|uniref:PiggyBac transposable element-derived protein domain-containing protein n=1 Tax=Plakobranchus ocellatus TaxID=259542 RepID=A0AAV4B3U6_9GAST|nr:hypothetical protein PoB_004076000 [Plakobranchus ocellatus]
MLHHQCFARFFADTVCKHVIKETIRYVNSKDDDSSTTTTVVEIKAFISILLISGSSNISRCKIYHEQQDKSLNAPISNTCILVSKGEQIKQVSKFKYLGYLITSDRRCTSEISKRIAMAKDTIQKMKPILANRNIIKGDNSVKDDIDVYNGAIDDENDDDDDDEDDVDDDDDDDDDDDYDDDDDNIL